jgi:endoglucanase
MLGVNLCGAEFGAALPGVYGQDYTYPTEYELDYYNSKGLNLIRLPFRWERVQPALFEPLDRVELERLAAFVDHARRRDKKVIPEPHNFARYRGEVVGTAAAPNAALADLWQRLACQFKCDSAIYAFGLMNEPHDTGGLWPAAAQAAVDAIRAVDPTTWILVPGDQWSGAADWRKDNEHLWVDDPAHRLMYEAHLYFDRDKSGRYVKSYDGEGGSPTIGIDRLRRFRDWLRERNAVGFVGEFGVPARPNEDPRWLESLERFVAHLREIEMSGCYWAGGPWWGEDHLSIEPRAGQDRPQMKILESYVV